MPDGISEGIHKSNSEHRDLRLIDLGEFLKSGGTRLGNLPDQIRAACEGVGFFFAVNHGVSEDLINRIFIESKRFHDLPFETKKILSVKQNQRGYIVPGATKVRHSTYNENTKFDTNATMVLATEYGEDNSHRQTGKRFYSENQWPNNLPGFKETVTEYMETLTNLGKKMLPLWASALELPKEFLEVFF